MSEHPVFAFQIDITAEGRDGGTVNRTVDVGRTMLEQLSSDRRMATRWINGEFKWYELRNILPLDVVRQIDQLGQLKSLSVPGLKDKLQSFLGKEDIHERIRIAHEIQQRVSRSGRAAAKADRLLNTVRSARIGDRRDFGMFYFDLPTSEYAAELETIRDELFWQEAEKRGLRTLDDIDDPKLRDELEKVACPFAFGTTAKHWTPIRIEDFIEEFGEAVANEIDEEEDAETNDRGPPPDFGAIAVSVMESMIEHEVDQHHEDARDEIVDEMLVLKQVEAWARREDRMAAGREVLEYQLSEWNHRQTVTSYYPDESVIIPFKMETTKEDCIRWCEAKAEEQRVLLDELMDLELHQVWLLDREDTATITDLLRNEGIQIEEGSGFDLRDCIRRHAPDVAASVGGRPTGSPVTLDAWEMFRIKNAIARSLSSYDWPTGDNQFEGAEQFFRTLRSDGITVDHAEARPVV
jgi:hypothetical protein